MSIHIGAKPGEIAEVVTPAGSTQFEVLSISR